MPVHTLYAMKHTGTSRSRCAQIVEHFWLLHSWAWVGQLSEPYFTTIIKQMPEGILHRRHLTSARAKVGMHGCLHILDKYLRYNNLD